MLIRATTIVLTESCLLYYQDEHIILGGLQSEDHPFCIARGLGIADPRGRHRDLYRLSGCHLVLRGLAIGDFCACREHPPRLAVLVSA